jgi:hypothetical protein
LSLPLNGREIDFSLFSSSSNEFVYILQCAYMCEIEREKIVEIKIALYALR